MVNRPIGQVCIDGELYDLCSIEGAKQYLLNQGITNAVDPIQKAKSNYYARRQKATGIHRSKNRQKWSRINFLRILFD